MKFGTKMRLEIFKDLVAAVDDIADTLLDSLNNITSHPFRDSVCKAQRKRPCRFSFLYELVKKLGLSFLGVTQPMGNPNKREKYNE